MTCAELIELLHKFPPDMRVLVDGYEGGYSDPVQPVIVRIKLDYRSAWYCGPHEKADDDEGCDILAVVIGR